MSRLVEEHGEPTTYEARVRGVRGWLVVNKLSNGLAFGGFRFSPTVSESEVRELAQAMSWKLTAHGLPVGGAKAGLCCAPDHPELPQIMRELADAWRGPLSSSVVLGRDMGATDALIDALYEGLGAPQLALAQARRPDCPNRIRDLTGYVRHMTGRGAAWAAEAAAGGLQGKRVAIQGAGLVGVGTVVRVTELGARVVAISDAAGCIVNPEGIPAEGVLAATEGDTRQIDYDALGFPCRRIPRDELFAVDADVVVLAAGSRTVSADVSNEIRADLVVEASNFGLTEQAVTALHARGVTVVPDVIASSSSAALVAHQLATGNGWSEQAVWHEIRRAIRASVAQSCKRAAAESISVRQAYLAPLSLA